MSETKPNFTSVLRDALGDRIDPAAESFVDMMAEDFVMEFPFARPGVQTRIEGRRAVIAYLMTVSQGVSIGSMSNVTVHETGDPQVVIVEFQGHGVSLKTDEVYEPRYISVIRTAGGRMVHYRDYWNPLAGLKAQLGSAAVDAFILGGAA